ncbi:MAG: amino acid adenylation domain-containing protein, partial [Ferruginibacter sp.]
MKNKQINKTLVGKTGKDLIGLMGVRGKSQTKLVDIVAPVSEVEVALFDIWKNILTQENFGINNDFFIIGGNSIKAIQLASKIARHFNIHVELTDIFVHPTITQFSEFIQTKQNGHSNHTPIEITPRPENIPLSFGQERLWFIDRVDGSIPYHVPAVLKFKGALNRAAMTHALQQIVARHEVLRTVIEEKDGRAFQRINNHQNWQLSVIDGSNYTENPDELRKFIQQLIRVPFDLSKDAMLRADLISLTDNDHVLVVTLHHIASDAWSLAILVKEFMELYNSFEEGRGVQLPPLEMQYADYTLWQKQDGQKIKLEKNLEYWKRKLDGVAPLQLPVDFAKPVNRTTNGGAVDFIIGKDLSDQLTEFTQEQGATLFMVLLATFKVMLHRYSGQQDICVGTSIANRNRREVEGLIGFFVNTLALRTEVISDTSFLELLDQVKLTTLAAYEHQDIPFEKIVEVVDTERDTSTSPLFQVMLVMPNTPDVTQLKLKGVETSAEAFLHNTSKYDLTFFIAETANGLQVSVEYNTDLFNADTIQKMSAHFEELLSAVVTDTHQKVGLLPMLTQAEQLQLEAFNVSIVAYPKDKTVVDLFEEQVIKNPAATALVFEGNQLSYKALNERANQLANYLRSRGVKEETLVPIFMERGLDMMVGIMGILKAGAAYVPIDTEFPAERISYMLEDSGSPILLCNAESKEKLTAQIDVEVIEIDGIEIQLQPTQNIATNLAPSNAAYVIYTSGSTGKPKGVIIEHRNLVDYVVGLNNKVQVNHCKSFALVSTIATDLGNTVIYASLLSGGALHIFSKDAATNVEMLHEYFATNKIDCLKIVPSHWKALCMGDELLVPAKLLVFGGEALRSEVVENIAASHPACKVVNHYGPTETTIGKLLHVVDATKTYARTIPIGKPFSNTQVYILSKDMQECPIGVPGQLYIAGDGVARGYYNNSELTNEKFITDPFATQPGSKMYGTGDMVRWLADGNIEFIGRVDDQVKIRGYRIELGEIERVLLQSPLVSEAVVLAKEDKQGNKKLVGYIVPGGTYDKDGVLAYMKEKLPDYMIPAMLMELESLPLTANGKIDRKSLPDPELSDAQSSAYSAPRTDAETALAEIWQELLDIETVGIHDNFFELGGDSIITIQLVSRARRAGYELQMGDVFTYQTIARLSALLDQRSNTSATASGEQFLLEGASSLLPIQQWFFDKDPLEPSHFNQTMLLRIDKGITEALLKRAIEQLTAHHDALRFKYYKKDGSWYQVYEHQSEMSRVVVEDLQSASPDQLSGLINDNSDRHQKSLDIEKGELVRVVLMQTPASEDANRLLFVVHHLAIDGVSWRILLEDLELLLTGFKNGSTTELGNKTSSYRQWYEALVKYGQSNNVLNQKSYWTKVLQNYQPIPVDKTHTQPVRIKDITHHTMRLDAAQTRLLTHDVPRVYHTEINDILMAALAKTFTEFAGTDKIIIGMEGHGRESIEAGVDTSRTVGWFTTHYPVLLKVNTGKGEDDLIKNIKEQLRQVPDKGLGFGVLKYINKEEAYQGKPGWDIIYNYLGQADNVFNTGQWLGMATEAAGADRSPEYVVSEKLVLNGMVQGGELVFHWSYSDKQYEKATIITLADKFRSHLELLIHHCISQQKNTGVVYTPSDYGLGKEVSYTELDSFLNQPFNGKPVSKSLERMYHLSGLQQGMLFHGLYDGDGAGYLNQFWCDLINPDIDILRKSWNQVLHSHTILRSAFYHDAFSIPVQVVYKEIKLPIDVIDFRGKNEVEQIAAQKQFEEDDRTMGFNFERAPLLRISLLRLDENRYRMLWSSHHILFDGWSRSVMMGELLNIYESFTTGKVLAPVTEDHYEDYIRYIELVDKDKEQAYWKSYLKNVEQSTLLPFIGTTTERNKGLGEYGSVILEISSEITEKIGQYAQRHRLTMNTLMQGVWSYLLHCYTASNDIVYGVIVSGRPDDLPNVEQRIGMFINALPLFSNLKEEQTIAAWFQDIQRDQVASRQYQYSTLSEIQEWAGLKGDMFDSLLVFENYPVSKILASKEWNLKVENAHVQEQTNYPLCLIINGSEQIIIDFNYNKQLLNENHVGEIRNHFEHVLLQLIEKGEGRVSDIELLTKPEKELLTNGFNNTIVDYPVEKSIIDLFEEQVLKTPQRIAVEFEGSQFTYQ